MKKLLSASALAASLFLCITSLRSSAQDRPTAPRPPDIATLKEEKDELYEANHEADEKKAPKAMLEEIKEVFERHNWKGGAIGLHDPDSAEEVTNAMGLSAHSATGLASNPGSLNCTPPAKPTFITIHRADGTLESGWACL